MIMDLEDLSKHDFGSLLGFLKQQMEVENLYFYQVLQEFGWLVPGPHPNYHYFRLDTEAEAGWNRAGGSENTHQEESKVIQSHCPKIKVFIFDIFQVKFPLSHWILDTLGNWH